MSIIDLLVGRATNEIVINVYNRIVRLIMGFGPSLNTEKRKSLGCAFSHEVFM